MNAIVNFTDGLAALSTPVAVGELSTSVSNTVIAGVAGSVAISVATAVVTTIATSFAASTAASVGVAATGTAAGSVAGSAAGGGAAGGAAVTSVIPLVLSAQRFSASAGLAVDTRGDGSDNGIKLAGSMDWVSGDFGIIEAPAAAGGTQADLVLPSNKTAMAFKSFLNILLSFLVVNVTVLMVQSLVHYHWRHRMNKEYYRTGRYKLSGAKFRAFPGIFVFPGLLMISISVFLTGATSRAVQLLSSNDTEACGSGCRTLAGFAILLVIGYEGLGLMLLVSFNKKYRTAAWKPAVPTNKPSKVVDPLYRLISKINYRSHSSWHGEEGKKKAVVDRSRGAFGKLPNETIEPGRTERLLLRPYRIMKANASDTLDAYGFSMMARSGGMTPFALSFEYSILSTGILVAALNGLGPNLKPGSGAAVAQMSVVLGLQLGHSIWVYSMKLSVDRIMNVLVGTQFLLEAFQTGLLIITTFDPPAPVLVALSILCATLSVIAPILQRFYDAIIVQLFKIYLQGGFNMKAAFFAMLGLLVFIPGMIVKFLGMESTANKILGTDTSTAAHGADDINKLAAKTANENLAKEIQTNAETVVAKAFWDAERRHAHRREMAVKLIQRRFRARKAKRETLGRKGKRLLKASLPKRLAGLRSSRRRNLPREKPPSSASSTPASCVAPNLHIHTAFLPFGRHGRGRATGARTMDEMPPPECSPTPTWPPTQLDVVCLDVELGTAASSAGSIALADLTDAAETQLDDRGDKDDGSIYSDNASWDSSLGPLGESIEQVGDAVGPVSICSPKPSPCSLPAPGNRAPAPRLGKVPPHSSFSKSWRIVEIDILNSSPATDTPEEQVRAQEMEYT